MSSKLVDPESVQNTQKLYMQQQTPKMKCAAQVLQATLAFCHLWQGNTKTVHSPHAGKSFVHPLL